LNFQDLTIKINKLKKMKLIILNFVLFINFSINNSFDLNKNHFKSKILPISYTNCKELCNKWKDNKNVNQKKVSSFENNIDNKNSIIYKYTPNQVNDVKALMLAQINLNKNILTINDVLPNPKVKVFDKKLFESDIYNLKKYNKEYKKFDIQIECNPIDFKRNNIDFINYLYARSIRKY